MSRSIARDRIGARSFYNSSGQRKRKSHFPALAIRSGRVLAVFTGELPLSGLLNTAQVPAAANTDSAAFDTNRPGTDIEKMALIRIAILDVIEGA
jgi:hypothetical protein